MANIDLAYGFKPFGRLLCLEPFSKDSSAAVSYINDLMEMDADGNVSPAEAADTQMIGSNQTFSTGSTAATLMIASDPDQLFSAQDDGSGTPAQTDIGNNADHLATAGSLVTKISAHEIALSTVGTGTAGLRLLDFVINDLNEEDADNADYVCIINEHAWGKTTTGV